MRIFIFLFCCFYSLFLTAQAAEIYRWVDERGKVHYTDRPPPQQQTDKLTIKVKSYDQAEIVEKLQNYRTYLSKDTQKLDNNTVIMYSTSWCPHCKRARQYFTQNNIPFREYDIEKSDKARRDYERLNGKGVPVILVGKRRMNGFSVAGFERLSKR